MGNCNMLCCIQTQEASPTAANNSSTGSTTSHRRNGSIRSQDGNNVPSNAKQIIRVNQKSMAEAIAQNQQMGSLDDLKIHVDKESEENKNDLLKYQSNQTKIVKIQSIVRSYLLRKHLKQHHPLISCPQNQDESCCNLNGRLYRCCNTASANKEKPLNISQSLFSTKAHTTQSKNNNCSHSISQIADSTHTSYQQSPMKVNPIQSLHLHPNAKTIIDFEETKKFQPLQLKGGVTYYGQKHIIDDNTILDLLNKTPQPSLIREGLGTQLWPDGSIYQGEWYRDHATGFGKMLHGDSGDIYIGQWLNDMAHGRGTYYHANSGAVYEGEWISDKQHGYGCERWPDGTEYTGSFQNGKKNGRGKMTFCEPVTRELQSYEGDFVENQIQGFGILTYHQSSKKLSYEGQWVANQKHGQGVLMYKNGQRFEGTFAYDKKHGQGQIIMVNNEIIEGEWSQGKFMETQYDNRI
ncbi:hypothetical protein FGO68_gene16424 [Halteria grandinella]|uniref:MORN repeat protein n=1 Tax=Halteria grandinella TaxID=5974 RepID=A0A8J8NH23_HALGN|nr:hypothetical protein FGO68_gene16424 [Halteria grandinella]